MSKELTIYTGQPEPLEQAIKTMTDYWIDVHKSNASLNRFRHLLGNFK